MIDWQSLAILETPSFPHPLMHPPIIQYTPDYEHKPISLTEMETISEKILPTLPGEERRELIHVFG